MALRHHLHSTRSLTRETGVFVRDTPGSQSLARGLQILRTFRHGVDALTNADIAERTGLARPTVSRLTRTLVDEGFLEYDYRRKGYQLSVASLSLALSFRASEPRLETALPLMRELAQGRQVNVGMATADLSEMVYLDSIRHSRQGIFRRIAAGSRIPIAITSLGCAYLAGLDAVKRQHMMHRLEREYGPRWPKLKRGVQKSLRAFRANGFCYAEWQSGIGAVAAPLSSPGGRTYALNISFPLDPEDTRGQRVADHARLLLDLVAKIQSSWDQYSSA